MSALRIHNNQLQQLNDRTQKWEDIPKEDPCYQDLFSRVQGRELQQPKLPATFGALQPPPRSHPVQDTFSTDLLDTFTTKAGSYASVPASSHHRGPAASPPKHSEPGRPTALSIWGTRGAKRLAASMDRVVELRAALPAVPTLVPVENHLRSLLRPGVDFAEAMHALHDGINPSMILADNADALLLQRFDNVARMSVIEAALVAFGPSHGMPSAHDRLNCGVDRARVVMANPDPGIVATNASRVAKIGVADVLATLWAAGTMNHSEPHLRYFKLSLIMALAASVCDQHLVSPDAVVLHMFAAAEGYIEGVETSSRLSEFADQCWQSCVQQLQAFPEDRHELELLKEKVRSAVADRAQRAYEGDTEAIKTVDMLVDAHFSSYVEHFIS